MGLFDTVRRVSLARITDRKASDVTWDGDRGWTLVRGKDGDNLPRRFPDYVQEGWRRNPVVRRCVTEYQTSVAEAPIHAYRRTDDGEFERIVGHPAEDLFIRPNEGTDGVGFIEQATQHYLLGGNTFMEKRRSGLGAPIEVHLHRPDYVVAADVDKKWGTPLRWEIITDAATGSTRWIKARDIVHIPDVDPLNAIFGMPRLASATLETDTDNKASSYVNEILTNYGSPGTLVMVDGDKMRNVKYLERAEDQWAEKFGPGRGRGKVAYLPGATRVQNIGFDLKELEFEALRKISREGICAVFGVDPGMIGLGSASKGGTLSGAEHESIRQAFWQQTIMPMFRRWNAVLNAFLAPEWGENVYLMFDVSEVAALQPDRDADVERAGNMAKTGAFTMEEIRAETGAAEELDDDDVLVLAGPSISYQRAGDVGQEPEETEEDGVDEAGADGEDDGAGAGDGDTDEGAEEEEDLAAALTAWEAKAGPAKRVVSSVGFGLTGYTVKVKEDRGLAWKQFDDFARSQEPAYRLQAEDLLQRQETELQRLALAVLRDEPTEDAGVAAPEEAKAITPESLDAFQRRLGERFTAYHREWRRRYDDLMSQTVDVVAGRLSGTTGLAFDVFNPLVRRAVEDRLNLIVGADELTFQAVKHVVEEGFVEGLSRNQMAERIASVVREGVTVRLPSGATRVLGAAERAKLIATTETTAISNKAAVALLRTTDIPWVKTWLTQGDDRVRPEHTDEEIDSEENPVPIDEAFRVTGLDAPAEPNCRCTTLFSQA